MALAHKSIQVAPATTFIAHTAHFCAQALLIVTFLLPIKILILLGSDSIPDDLPQVFKALSKTWLITALIVLTVLSYALYLSSELVASRYSRTGAYQLMNHSSQSPASNNQRPLAVLAFCRFTRGLSAASFVTLMALVMLSIYPALFTITLLYIVAVTALLIVLFNRKDRIRSIVRRHHTKLLNAMSALGFLGTFAFMVVDFLYMTPVPIYIALLSLILVRQSLTRLKSMIEDAIYLKNHQQKIHALFFTH
ncbi:Uncharacterised protein [Pseudomonas fluorescens]|uniref:Uncharacterized protein n=1 Tax=Pseudomonas fluorescens TaxID=294 RepID=A0A379IGT5_PSEFL|nr:hypothetical protein HZ99_08235 [Pseudomonas fluorescens]SUD32597.1 Uncharacterised protein [Pseudomonas fluorescens]